MDETSDWVISQFVQRGNLRNFLPCRFQITQLPKLRNYKIQREAVTSAASRSRGLDTRATCAGERCRPYNLRRLSGALAFDGLGAAHVNLDLLGLGFGLLGQGNLQHALVVVGLDLLGVYGVGQGEGAGEAAVLALHAAVILFFLFLF